MSATSRSKSCGKVRARECSGACGSIRVYRLGRRCRCPDGHWALNWQWYVNCNTFRVLRASEVILLVEDDDAIRRLVRVILESRGFIVLEAGDGREGLRRYEAHLNSIDLLLTDVMMPELDGCELANRALKLRPQLRVLLMSGSSGHVGLDQQIGRGAAFLEKPFTRIGLIDKVRDTLSFAA